MHKILPFSDIIKAEPYMDAKVLKYIDDGLAESFECFSNFDIVAFDWYDVHSSRTDNSKMLLYLDKENLFVFYSDEAAGKKLKSIFEMLLQEENMPNERLLYHFFAWLLKGDREFLNNLEYDISKNEDSVLSGGKFSYIKGITSWRQELLRLKRYYEQLNSIFDEMTANDNRMLSGGGVRLIQILSNRTDRYLRTVENLLESVAHLQEAYQSQLAIQQNDLMKIFTVVTVIFLPLTLLTGWYGMNFAFMPELRWKYGYPAVIVLCIAILTALIWYFKKKKWL